MDNSVELPTYSHLSSNSSFLRILLPYKPKGGCRISKKTLDFAVRDHKRPLFHVKVDNTPTGLKQFQKECLARNIDFSQCLICCEHTGIYSQNILTLTTEANLSLWLESSLRIKGSLGLQRGKSARRPAPGARR